MLNIDWYFGMIGQCFVEWDIFNIFIKWYVMNNVIFGIDNIGYCYGDGGKVFQFFLMVNKEVINMVDNVCQKWCVVGECQFQLIFYYQLIV